MLIGFALLVSRAYLTSHSGRRLSIKNDKKLFDIDILTCANRDCI